MYNVRYHLASLISVFFALAIGLILGGLIADRAPENIHEVLLEGIERDIAQVREDNSRLRAENTVAYEFADLLLNDFIRDRFEEETILVLGEDGAEARIVMDALEDAGATAVHAVPGFDEDSGEWRLQADYDFEELQFSGVVTVFEPAGEASEYLSGYLVFLHEVQEFYEIPVIFMTSFDEDEEERNDLIAIAWEEGFSGTNQLGNRYGTYTLIVLLASNIEGMFGSGEDAIALYPTVPSAWLFPVELDEEGPEEN